jgi:hypothetical protein
MSVGFPSTEIGGELILCGRKSGDGGGFGVRLVRSADGG